MLASTKQTGFTLIEAVIVFVIIGIISVFVAARWHGPDMSLDAQTDQLARDIRYTQSLAMQRAEQFRINLNAGANQYTIFDNGGTPIIHPASNTSTITLSGGVQLNTSGNIIFNSLGVPISGAGNYNLSITAGGNRTISVTPETGRVTVS